MTMAIDAKTDTTNRLACVGLMRKDGSSGTPLLAWARRQAGQFVVSAYLKRRGHNVSTRQHLSR